MSEFTPNFGARPDGIILATNGLEFVEQHQRPIDAPEATDETATALRGVRKLRVADLPQHADVDPDLKAAVDPSPGLKSEF